MTAKKKKAKRITKVKDFDLSGAGPMELARIVTYLRCEDAGVKVLLNKGDKERRAKMEQKLKKMDNAELDRYKAIAGVGKYRPKSDPNAPKRCSKCGHYPPVHQGSNFPSRMDTWTPMPSIIDVIRDQQTRDAYANEMR